jgi:hypothetical protein
MNNFDLKKFLVENKLTTSSRLAEESNGARNVYNIIGDSSEFSIDEMPDFQQSLNKQGVADYVMDVYFGDEEEEDRIELFDEWIDHVTYYNYDKQDYIYGNFTDEAFVIPLDETSGLLVVDKKIASTASRDTLLSYYRDIAL